MTSTKENLLLLFERMGEPAFMPKGTQNSTFDIPENYLVDNYKLLKNDLDNRFGGDDKIPIKTIDIPDLSSIMEIGRRENFCLFLPKHHRIAARLIAIFMGMRTLEDFLSLSVYCRDRINPYLFIYCLSVAILHRPDTKDVRVPALSETFPDKFVDGAIVDRAKEESNIVPTDKRTPLEIPVDYTASDLEEEHRVAYFREDLGINLHHWHWHLVYPFDAALNIVNKDRRGELFYYMHQQILARYNFERLSNKLARVKRLQNWHQPIKEGYFPKLDSLVASRVCPSRPAYTCLKDINREVDQINFDIKDLERWCDRMYAAIHSGNLIDAKGQTVALTESRGIDVLGNTIEASNLSINKNLYGGLHNLGHVAIAMSHDPDNRHLETFQVMGDPATAMRDPVFYRWHAFINDIFKEHKNTLPRYSTAQLDYPGVRVTGVEIVPDGGAPTTSFSTFWRQDDVDLSRGLDFTPRGSILARHTHLYHVPFSYKIKVDSKKAGKGTVRIFLAPAQGERDVPFLFREQCHLFVELDKFVVQLTGKPQTLVRKSSESTVTIPYEQTFRNLDAGRPDEGSEEHAAFNFCGCGWPQHMLVPKGSAEGFPCHLFVMISNYDNDKVEQGDTSKKPCADAASYCGIRDNLYPDKRPMGYPFDRLPRDGVDTLAQFLTPNMKVTPVTINFTNRVEPPPQAASA